MATGVAVRYSGRVALRGALLDTDALAECRLCRQRLTTQRRFVRRADAAPSPRRRRFNYAVVLGMAYGPTAALDLVDA
ncbi:hypothetical protein [Metallibacterium scheffleri]|uniref:hypothetical protein n=1 Tax=Metallibacterium scheffleri TaxID=993689 RepID=UPI00109FE99C|nr:hypothetical protein [Metallibacterium scheffleri]